MRHMIKDALQIFLETQFPNSKIEFIGEGWSSTAFIVDDKIIRFPKGQIEEYKKEAAITNAVRNQVNVEIPEITIVEDQQYPYAIHKILPGKTWNIREVKKLDTKTRNLLIKDIAEFLHSVHQIKNIPGLIAEKPNIIAFQDIEPFIKNHFSQNEISKLYKEYETANARNIKDITFIHGDFSGYNSLVDENHRLIGVFDWVNCSFGERTIDFHRFYNAPDFLKDISKEYENLSGISIDIERIREIRLIDALTAAYWINADKSLADMVDGEMKWIIASLRGFL